MKFHDELSLSSRSGSLCSLEAALLRLGLRKDSGLHQTTPSRSLLVFSCHPSEEVLNESLLLLKVLKEQQLCLQVCDGPCYASHAEGDSGVGCDRRRLGEREASRSELLAGLMALPP